MEITTETKIRLFAQYIGCKVQWMDESAVPFQRKGQRRFNLPDGFSGVSRNIDHYALVLKPLSSITDEDIEKMCVMLWGDEIEAEIIRTDSAIDVNIINTGSSFIIFHDGEILDAEREFTGNRIPSLFFCYQLLQQLGYDLPHYLLGGKTLKEAGLAIYS